MSVLVTGGGGQLGLALARRGGEGVRALTRASLDVTDAAAVDEALGALRPRVVVNAAAWTAVDAAETHETQAWALNATAPGVLATLCAARGVGLVHLSTDYVFDGRAGRPYQPEDTPAPLNVYGRSKLAGEVAVREALAEHVILRTSWVVGPDRPNFVATMVRLAATQDRLRVVDDQLGGLTPADDLADAVLAVVDRWDEAPWGTWHVCGRPWASWYEVATEVVRACGSPAVVEAVPSSAWPTPARRPLDGRLDPTAFEGRFGVHIDWRRSLPGLVAAWKGRERP